MILYLNYKNNVYKVENVNGAQCSKWHEISDMDIFQITEENPDPEQQTKGLILIFY